ncbi:hypothetical protein [Neptuniibacter sp. CAU 1671]|uniref:hypothetical protein n=1 Tax=Neptuniibacter sp. CAU 1671 TaxID=3032593 RepID=UPI0023D9F3DF|nr:hypothetical protein [Neptuniibacter sp. CAU 1671]MDF2183004.1 hypothetical protein [Neptuniibacter sp. CAU 1671]
MLRFGVLLLAVPALIIIGFYFAELNDVQACLDTGGSWNYQQGVCDQQASHPFIPFLVRYPLLVNGGMLLSCVGLILCIVGLYRPKQ